ncbi:MAG TPA: FG-GAP-like repeat-containing protein [Bacteroidota bacterium]|nr:FG-GAP-like repeat-containing protein [Bacteroidota bacterium]
MRRPGTLPDGHLPDHHPEKKPLSGFPAFLRPVTLIAAMLCAPGPLGAQIPRSAFDYVSEMNIPLEASLLARGDFNADGIPDLITAGPRGLSVFLQGKSSFDWTVRTGTLMKPPSLIATGRVNRDGRDDLLVYSADPPAVAVYVTGSDGVPVYTTSIQLTAEFGELVGADLDGDGTSDILLFGKKTLGITVYRGDGRGRFTPGPVLHPEISVSLVSVARMDDDDIPDLVAVNWVANQVLVSSGFGTMNFSDPVTIACPQEPVALAVGDLDANGIRDIVAGYGERPSFTILTGDGSGNFTELTKGEIPSRPGRIRIGDVDGDGFNDLAIFTPDHRSLSVRFFGRISPFTRNQVFSAGKDAGDVIFFLDRRKRVLNAAGLRSSGTILRILHNRTITFPGPAGWQFVTGTDPSDMEVTDLNGDGWPDVVLTQASDRAVNLFLNNGRGSLLGMVSVPIPEPSYGILPIGSDPAGTGFLLSGVDGRSISYVRIRKKDLSGEVRTVRAEGGLEAIDAGAINQSSVTRIYAICHGIRNGLLQVCAFDAADRTRFEQIEIPVKVGTAPVGMLSHDFNGDGRRDLAVVSVRDMTGGLGLEVLLQTDEGFAPERVAAWDVDAGPEHDIRLWAGDIDSDGHDDLVFNTGDPLDGLYVSMAAGDGGFGPAAQIMTGVRVPGHRALVMVDFDSDGKADLVFINEKSRTIQFLPGEGAGHFAGPVNLMGAKGISGIGVADINRDSEQELLVAGEEQGTLAITTFHHPLFGRGNR